MTFSDRRVAAFVKENFVAVWLNRAPGFLNTDLRTEAGILQWNYEAFPTKNICTFFLTPKGKVFHYVAGSYAPELFLEILDTALSVHSALFDERLRPIEGGLAQAAKIHSGMSDLYARRQVSLLETLQAKDGWRGLVEPFRCVLYRGERHVHRQSCATSLRDGYEYLASLHGYWSRRQTLPDFEEVRYCYRFGNEFTEETKDAPQVKAPDEKEKPKPEPAPAPPREVGLPAIRTSYVSRPGR